MQGVVFAYAGVEMGRVWPSGETETHAGSSRRPVNSVGWRIAIFYVGSVLLLTMLLPSSMYKSGESPFVTALDRSASRDPPAS